jgi:hypothetical protein
VVTVTESPVRRLAVLAAVGIAATGLLVVGLWLLAGFAVSTFPLANSDASTSATVITQASCQGADDHDTVSFQSAGTPHQAKVDSCGRQPGERIMVLVPASLDANTVVEPAATAPGDSSGLLHRVAFLLLIISAAVGGAFYHFLLRRPAGRDAEGRASDWFAETSKAFTDSR